MTMPDHDKPLIRSPKHAWRVGVNKDHPLYKQVEHDLYLHDKPDDFNAVTDAMWAMGGIYALNPHATPVTYGEWLDSLEGAPDPDPSPVPPPSRIMLDGRAWRTSAGHQCELGASLFWLPAAMKENDEAVFEDLAFLRDGPFSFARIWQVKTYKDGRRTWPTDAYHWNYIAMSYRSLAEHGLRAMATLFAGGSEKLTPEARRAYVKKAIEVANAHRDTIMMIEIMNEFYTKGVDVAELRDLGRLASGLTDIPIALSAPGPPDDDETESGVIEDVYHGFSSPEYVATNHWDRDWKAPDGAWRPVRQPWHYQDARNVPQARINSEPIGPGSSGHSDTDPVRLAAAYANTFFCGSSAYVLHGSWWDGKERIAAAPTIQRTVDTMAFVRDRLPGNLANWTASNHRWSTHPFTGLADQRHRFVRAYARLSSAEDWVCIIGVSGPLTLNARTRTHMEVWDLATRSEVYNGEAEWVSPATTAYLVRLT